MENCKLSRDMVVDILSRLPVKSLMRFKCVCKFFYDLIKSDHYFMHKHYEISKAKTDCVLLDVGRAVRGYYLLYKESEYNEIGCIYLDIPRTPREQSVKCCKGVLCLISTKNDNLKLGDYLIYDILIWNPSIRKIKALPSVTVPYRAPCDAFVLNEFGFGISNNMIWKVVMLLEICSLGDDRRTVQQITMVYSQDRGDSWNLRQINSVTSCRNIQSNDFYLKGRYYWKAETYYNEYLIWFDMNDEVFGTIELPSNYFSIISISIMNDTIALLGFSSVRNFACIDILLMIENDNSTTCWRKQASIGYALNIDDNIEFWRPIAIWNVDRELLVSLGRKVDWNSDWNSENADKDVPYFISVDLVTQERKIFLSKERKSITMTSNPSTGHFQIYNENNTDDIIREVWKHNICNESLHFP